MMLDKYLSLLDDLIKLRESNKGTESDEEDRLLDDMDSVWEKNDRRGTHKGSEITFQV